MIRKQHDDTPLKANVWQFKIITLRHKKAQVMFVLYAEKSKKIIFVLL